MSKINLEGVLNSYINYVRQIAIKIRSLNPNLY